MKIEFYIPKDEEIPTRHEDGAITPDCYIVDSGEYFWGGVDSV